MNGSASSSSSSTTGQESSVLPASELSLGTRVALEAAKSSIEQAVNIVHEELSSLQAEHALLQSQHLALQNQHRELQVQYQTQVDSWKEFKSWWKKTSEKKKAANSTQQTPARLGINNNYPSSPLITPSTVNKAKLTTSELALLDRVGLDCSAFSTPATENKERGSIARVKREDDGNIYRMERISSPLEPRRIQSDGASYSDRKIQQQNNKRRRSSPGADEFSSPSRRRVLEDVGNKTKSNVSEELEESLTKRNQFGRLEESRYTSEKRKGRGRYSTGILDGGKSYKTINEEFQIDPEKNGNVSFLHKAVVRDKSERKQMHAHDCECCSEYYKAVGQAPLRRYQDPRSVVDQLDEEEEIGPSGEENDDDEDEEEKRRQAHRQQISRHRGYGPPAATPPGYWNVGFPSTQQQEEVNRIAREEHAKRRNQVARDPRFKKRS